MNLGQSVNFFQYEKWSGLVMGCGVYRTSCRGTEKEADQRQSAACWAEWKLEHPPRCGGVSVCSWVRHVTGVQQWVQDGMTWTDLLLSGQGSAVTFGASTVQKWEGCGYDNRKGLPRLRRRREPCISPLWSIQCSITRAVFPKHHLYLWLLCLQTSSGSYSF